MLFIFKYIACLNILQGQGHKKKKIDLLLPIFSILSPLNSKKAQEGFKIHYLINGQKEIILHYWVQKV